MYTDMTSAITHKIDFDIILSLNHDDFRALYFLTMSSHLNGTVVTLFMLSLITFRAQFWFENQNVRPRQNTGGCSRK